MPSFAGARPLRRAETGYEVMCSEFTRETGGKRLSSLICHGTAQEWRRDECFWLSIKPVSPPPSPKEMFLPQHLGELSFSSSNSLIIPLVSSSHPPSSIRTTRRSGSCS